MRILGIESSCDETGIAIYDDEQGLKQRIEEMGDFRISADLRVHLLKTCYQEALKFIS